jgi:hypothetical protein
MNQTASLGGQPRPLAVVALYIIFCFAALTFFVLFGLQLVYVVKGLDKSASVLEVSGAMLALAVRFVGMTRLFLMKADSWLWLVVALVIGLPITILSILHHRLLGNDLTAPVLASVVHYLIATGIIVYAFRLFQEPGRS